MFRNIEINFLIGIYFHYNNFAIWLLKKLDLGSHKFSNSAPNFLNNAN